jgi:uncharacterized protein
MVPLKLLEEIRPYYEAQDPGHDWIHIQRVVKSAQALAQEEGADLTIVLAAAYLHDIVNIPKNHPERHRASELAAEKAEKLLSKYDYPQEKIPIVAQAIREHSYSRGLTPSSLESACVKDADRLDALGAIGILRCTAVNVAMGSKFYEPDDPFATARELNDRQFMIDHYFVKLLKLQDSFQTRAGKAEAKRRTDFMRQFLNQLKAEI